MSLSFDRSELSAFMLQCILVTISQKFHDTICLCKRSCFISGGHQSFAVSLQCFVDKFDKIYYLLCFTNQVVFLRIDIQIYTFIYISMLTFNVCLYITHCNEVIYFFFICKIIFWHISARI